MKAIFKEVGMDKESDEDMEFSSDDDQRGRPSPVPYDRKNPYGGGAPGGIATPKGHERRTDDPIVKAREDAIKGLYDQDSDDEILPDKWKKIYRQQSAKTPKGRGTLRSYRARVRRKRAEERRKRAEEILNQIKTKNYRELTTEEFAIVETEKRLFNQIQRLLNRKQRLTKEQDTERLIRIYGGAKEKIPRPRKLQLRL